MTLLDEAPIIEHKTPHVHAGLRRSLLEVSKVDGCSAVTRSLAHSPLKLVVPRSRGECVWAFSSTFGGGLVGGDCIELDVRCADGTRTVLSTQASTKVYRTMSPLPTRQSLCASVGSRSLLVVAPDPLTCFAGADYQQEQRFEIAADSGLIAIDWLTSGRAARGERWAFDRYHASNEVLVEGRCIYRDVLLLDPTDGDLRSPMRMGKYECLASVVLAGELVMPHVEVLLSWISRQPIGGELLFSASPLNGGAVLRVAGPSSETVGRWLRERLAFVKDELREDPWARKF